MSRSPVNGADNDIVRTVSVPGMNAGSNTAMRKRTVNGPPGRNPMVLAVVYPADCV